MTNPDSKPTREGDVHTRDGDATLWEIVEDAVRDARFRERAGRATGSDLCMITLANRLTAAEQEIKGLKAEVRRQTSLHNLHCDMECCPERERVRRDAARNEGKGVSV